MDFKNQKAIYLQIADHICDEILSGRYLEDGKLPSVREYAAQVEVNVNTVTRSFEWLQLHDIVTTRRGLGNFVATGARREIEALRKEEFFNEKLPDLFRSMQALGIKMDEVVAQYENRESQVVNRSSKS
ncbi:MAG: GntR family transcriptional regulator [Bacteroidaceae bacterium]|nr:GntR family transcriptional regulator [Bacteroidaceae bacterium]